MKTIREEDLKHFSNAINALAKAGVDAVAAFNAHSKSFNAIEILNTPRHVFNKGEIKWLADNYEEDPGTCYRWILEYEKTSTFTKEDLLQGCYELRKGAGGKSNIIAHLELLKEMGNRGIKASAAGELLRKTITNLKSTQMENEQFDITKVAIKSDGTRERGKRIIEFFEKHGVKNPLGYTGNGESYPFYMTNKRGEICHHAGLSDKTLIDLPPEQPKLPCVMEVWDDDESIADKRIVLWINPHGKDEFPVKVVSYDDTESFKRGEAYRVSEYKYAKPIQENPKRIRKMQLLEKVEQLENEVKKLRNEAEQI